MPALITHYLCGSKMISLIEDDTVKKHISDFRNAFNLGTQGPDILFYYGAWPWTKSKGIPEIGNRLHDTKTGQFISEALKYSSGSDEDQKSLLTAYLYGYICHYALDCHTHPYIFYRTGFVRKGESYTGKYTCYHRMFETALDVLMLERELGLKPPEFNASEKIRVSRQASASIGELYSNILERVYSENIDIATVCQAISDISAVSSALRDRTGIKKLLLKNIEKLMGKLPMFSSMILPLKIIDGRDYLNLLHNIWSFPWDPASVNTASFPDMFEAAAAEAAKLCTAAKDYIYEGAEIEKVMDLIGNRSFSTGMDCSLDNEFVSFDCIYE